MSELAVTLLRLSYLVLLWLFVLFTLGALRRDVFGTTVTSRGRGRQRSATPVRTAAAPQPSRHNPTRLIVTHGPLTGSAVPLGDTAVIVGRSSTCSLVLDDDYSSSRHARFFQEHGQWYVEDLNSTNGTFLDGQRISNPTPVATGQGVKIGQSVMELRR